MKVIFKKDTSCALTWHVYYDMESPYSGICRYYLCSIHVDSIEQLVKIPRDDYGPVSEFEAELNISVLEVAG